MRRRVKSSLTKICSVLPLVLRNQLLALITPCPSPSTFSSRAVILFSLLSSWDVRPAIVCVSLSSLSDSACGYKADFIFRSTSSSLSSSMNFMNITSVLPTSLSVTLEGFRAFFTSPTKSAGLRHGSHLGKSHASAIFAPSRVQDV